MKYSLQYKAIAAQAAALGLPTHYKTDLTEQDRDRLCTKNPPAVFFWGVRDCGTDLIVPESPQSLDYAAAAVQMSNRWYCWRDGSLTELAAADLAAAVAPLVFTEDHYIDTVASAMISEDRRAALESAANSYYLSADQKRANNEELIILRQTCKRLRDWQARYPQHGDDSARARLCRAAVAVYNDRTAAAANTGRRAKKN